MGETTGISWTDHTFNPWWGCVKISPACTNCYADTFSKRTGFQIWGPDTERRFFGDKHWNEPLKWNEKAAKDGVRRKVFCASMADICEDHPALGDARLRLWSLIRKTPNLDWQLLTKRPENYKRFLPQAWLDSPLPNVWLGTTVENQEYANIRIPRLATVPAALRWLSVEPLLGRIDLIRFLQAGVVDWMIVGGESGASYRPLDIDDAEYLRDQCETFKVPYFFKQVGGRYSGELGHLLNGVEYHQFPEVAK